MAMDWRAIDDALPTDDTEQARERRRQLFAQFDPNANGLLSLAEIDKGVKDVLQLPQLFKLKPVIFRAYEASKALAPSKSEIADDYVQLSEFRALLRYLKLYFELYVMFQQIDVSGDRRIEFAEFEKSLDLLRSWGVEIDSPRETFDSIDANGGGMVLFDEFSDWAIKRSLRLQ